MAPETAAVAKASSEALMKGGTSLTDVPDSASAISKTTITNSNSQISNSTSTSTTTMMAAPKSPPRGGTISKSNNPSSNTSTTPGGTKRTPYRRTKRKPGMDYKSTVTHTTDTALQHMNAFDMVIQESNDLMQAAMEAQQLGRLKMSSTYLLLLHARLVGLGKRFDKADQQQQQEQQSTQGKSKTPTHETDEHDDDQDETNVAGLEMDMSEDDPSTAIMTSTKKAKLHDQTLTSPPRLTARTSSQPHSMLPPHSTPKSNNLQPKISNTAGSTTATASTSQDPPFLLATPKTTAAKQLAQMLPESIEMDQAMMEHLARAAAQLHAARSGKARRQQEQAVMRQQYMAAATAQQQQGGEATAATTPNIPLPTIPSNLPTGEISGTTTNNGDSAATPTTTNVPNNAVSFTVKEYKLLHAAAQSGKPNHEELAKQTGRSEVQIKAFLRNLDTKNRILEDHLDILQDEEGNPQQQQQQQQSKGRGRKPATTAINTVPNAVCDARVLLRGNLLASNNTNTTTSSGKDDSIKKDEQDADGKASEKKDTEQSKSADNVDDDSKKKGDP